MYAEVAEAISKLDRLSEVKVLMQILLSVDKNRMEWVSHKSVRNSIAFEIKVSPITVERAINRLREAGFLIRRSKGVYKVNPEMFEFNVRRQ